MSRVFTICQTVYSIKSRFVKLRGLYELRVIVVSLWFVTNVCFDGTPVEDRVRISVLL